MMIFITLVVVTSTFLNPSCKFVVRHSTTLEEFLTLDQVCSEKCPDSNQITFLISHGPRVTRHYHLIVYDLINREVIDRFQIDCLPATICIDCISKLDGTNFLLSVDKRNIVVLSLETRGESSVVSYPFPHTLFHVTLSPDHLYV